MVGPSVLDDGPIVELSLFEVGRIKSEIDDGGSGEIRMEEGGFFLVEELAVVTLKPFYQVSCLCGGGSSMSIPPDMMAVEVSQDEEWEIGMEMQD